MRPPGLPVVSAASEAALEACVRQIGDVTGDDIADLSVIGSTRRGKVTAYLIAGPHDPTSLLLDSAYVRDHLIAVLTGPAAVPFTCSPQTTAQTALVATGAPLHRPRRPATATTALDSPAHYELVDLDPLSPGGLAVANGLNAAGHVVGNLLTADGLFHAFVYDGTSPHDVGTLGGRLSDARGINRRGDIVGYSLTGAVDDFGFINTAFISDGRTMQSLERDWSAASSINDAGQIVGETRFTPGVDLLHAFLYNHGGFFDLGTLPPLATTAFSTAHAINQAGWVVGESDTYTVASGLPEQRYPSVRGFLWRDGVMHDLGSLGVQCRTLLGVQSCFERSVATDINSAGAIVGFSSTETNNRGHAFFSDGVATLRDLGTLDGSASWAYGINDSGQVVGGFSSVNNTYMAPFLYERGTMYNLNDLVVNPTSSQAMPFAAYDINNFGQIVGNHHVLNPIYDQVVPGRPLQFDAVLGRRLTFAYWVSRGAAAECSATRSRLRLEVKFQNTDGDRDEWNAAAVTTDCSDSTDWNAVSVQIPLSVSRDQGVVRIRLREIGPQTAPSVYLRHFSIE